MQIGGNNPRVDGASHAHGAQPVSKKAISSELKTNVDKVKALAKGLPFGEGKPPTITQGKKDSRIAELIKSRL